MITIVTTIGEMYIEPFDTIEDIALHWKDGKLRFTHIPSGFAVPANLDHLPLAKVYNLASDISDLLQDMPKPNGDDPLYQAVMRKLIDILIENNALRRGNDDPLR